MANYNEGCYVVIICIVYIIYIYITTDDYPLAGLKVYPSTELWAVIRLKRLSEYFFFSLLLQTSLKKKVHNTGTVYKLTKISLY